ncbi:ring-cleaving dioxygenase [Cognatiyoonia sp. IB215182]|uniref:ring-cleaving dioxygenase n=1 Tax=Cognatiyoonia sp. IB215182 TaxID=3097353 RepID=UPI002A0B4B53|nr:ring-cleaving dioxygenase [Cognatiyoonia sp. IB215182]MDX8352466.1 ring-cleaving dioxygenase [Cognatiyoonia sp. IB215182]
MKKHIKGLHHVTSMAADAQVNNAFFTQTLGLRRVKKTVNFDDPGTYHLYYGDKTGTPGSVMTYFPFGQMPKGKRGNGEVGVTEFAVAKDTLGFWQDRLSEQGVTGLSRSTFLGENRLAFDGSDGDGFALVETERSGRTAWTSAGVDEETGILGFHGARFRLNDAAATAELLTFMGYEKDETDGNVTRYRIEDGNAARTIDLEELPGASSAYQGAGSVHHIAFAVENRAAQDEMRKALLDTGYQVTPVIDRDYFHAIYFRTPGGILFEIATNEPGFDRDEDTAHLGEALKLPAMYQPYRSRIESALPVLAQRR